MSVPGHHPSTPVRWVRNPEVLVRRGAFGLLLLAPTGDQPVLLEGTGIAIWDAIETPHTEADLAADLASVFGADPATVATDLRVALDALGEADLVVTGGA